MVWLSTPATLTTWPMGAMPSPSPCIPGGSIASCTSAINTSSGTAWALSIMTSRTVPPTVSMAFRAAVYTAVSHAATSGESPPITPLYHSVTAAEGIMLEGSMPPFHTANTLTAPTPGRASTFSL